MDPKSQMQIVVRIGVTFTADGYEQAGEILDAIDRKVGKVLAGRGSHDITSFETRPCKAQQFDHSINQAAARADQAMHVPMEYPSPRYEDLPIPILDGRDLCL